jgi:hypothetical protein
MSALTFHRNLALLACLLATTNLFHGWPWKMDETSREETDDQIDEDYSPIPEETRPLASSGLIFATFAEPGSSGMPGIESKARLEPYLFYPDMVAPPCRIALKPDPLNQGQYVWTYVPQAKGEGPEPNMWPQEVIILGYVLFTEARLPLADRRPF